MLIASAKRFVSALTKRGKSGGMALIRMSLGVFVLGLVAGCHTAPQPTRSADWDKYVAGYLEAYFAVHPEIAVGEGRHEFDGKLPDWSKSGLDREAARLH